jgi:hypothetical protein
MEHDGESYSCMPLSALQPSQLFINREKLEDLQNSIDFVDSKNIPPIPIKKLDGCWVMTDGHTRAFAAYLAQLEKVPTVLDEDELDWEAYKICVDWCVEANIRTISDLAGRVIDPDAYESRWIARCKAMQNSLTEK